MVKLLYATIILGLLAFADQIVSRCPGGLHRKSFWREIPRGDAPLRYSVRYMQEDDLPQVAEIDREAYPTQWPYPAYAYKRELNNHLASYIVIVETGVAWKQTGRNRNGHSLLGPLLQWFRHGSRAGAGTAKVCVPYIAGFAGVWRMLDEAHLTTIAVRENRRRQGIGELLLVTVTDMAIEFKASVVTLEVRVSNHVAQALYRKYGFKDAGTRKAYYSEDREDALIMTTDAITSEEFQTRFKELKQAHARRMTEADSRAGPIATAI